MHDKKDSFEAIFKNLEEKQAEDRARRVVALEQKLDALDRDLAILACGTAKDKWSISEAQKILFGDRCVVR